MSYRMEMVDPGRRRILLISPRGPLYRNRTGIWKKSLRYAPLTLTTLAALVPEELDAEVVVVDEGIHDIDWNAEADIVGISAITGTAPRCYELAGHFRKRGVPVVLGGVHPTLVPSEAARHEPTGELAGVVCRAKRRVWIDGQKVEVGYLSGGRVDERFRGRWLVPRGLRFLGDLDATDTVTIYLATITGENHEARGLLVEKPRHGFPRFEEVGRLYTAVIPVRATLVSRDQANGVRSAVLEDLPRIVSFLGEHG